MQQMQAVTAPLKMTPPTADDIKASEEIIQTLHEFNLYPTEEDMQKRQSVLMALKSIVQDWAKEMVIQKVRYTLVLRYALGFLPAVVFQPAFCCTRVAVTRHNANGARRCLSTYSFMPPHASQTHRAGVFSSTCGSLDAPCTCADSRVKLVATYCVKRKSIQLDVCGWRLAHIIGDLSSCVCSHLTRPLFSGRSGAHLS